MAFHINTPKRRCISCLLSAHYQGYIDTRAEDVYVKLLECVGAKDLILYKSTPDPLRIETQPIHDDTPTTRVY